MALTHKSYNSQFNNEKLEFLGDRVIALALSKKIFDLYPEISEGYLDKKFAKLVNKNTCLAIANSINLGDFVISSNFNKNYKNGRQKILSDTCEALIGAIYLDKGFVITEEIIINLWKKELLKSNITVIDSKTKLQEFSLKKYKKLPIYKLEDSAGPQHDPTFKVSVKIFNTKRFVGIGSSKKDAEQDAANNLVKFLKL